VIQEGTHWLVHEQGMRVAGLIQEWSAQADS
jgi:hypothetical protein